MSIKGSNQNEFEKFPFDSADIRRRVNTGRLKNRNDQPTVSFAEEDITRDDKGHLSTSLRDRSVGVGDDRPSKTKKKEGFDFSGKNQYWITRLVTLRGLAFVYFVTFLSAWNDNRSLIGSDGITPAYNLIERYRSHFGIPSGVSPTWETRNVIFRLPTILWWAPDRLVADTMLDVMALVGLTTSLVIMITGASNALATALLWICYTSIVNVGGQWYSFGWETLLLEAGFLMIFCVPVWSWQTMSLHTPPPALLIWGYRWLLFRLMIGSGLIKLRGDSCWWDLTCMNYHYETQPNPNPFAWFLHQSPWWIHSLEVMGNHFIELLFPFFTFLPRGFRIFNGLAQIAFQVILICSGNLSFLNWLTIVPAITLFDDSVLSRVVSAKTKEMARQRYVAVARGHCREKALRKTTYLSMALLILYLSVPVVQNLLSNRQIMNGSFDPLRIVNTYGNFGSITKERTEIIIQGTLSKNPRSAKADWREYEFKCKLGDTRRRPCLISPYHYRFDWVMWFVAFQDIRANPWILNVCWKLLNNSPAIMALLERNPFSDPEGPPRFIRIELYLYEFTKMGSPEARAGHWWKRRRLDTYLWPVDKEFNLTRDSPESKNSWRVVKSTDLLLVFLQSPLFIVKIIVDNIKMGV